MSIRHALLALLHEGPKYGLQLRQEFEAETGEVWPLNVGQVYTSLQRMERDGLVEVIGSAGDGPQKLHRLTDTGRTELLDWLEPPRGAPPPRDELVIKVLIASRISGVDVTEVIQSHRTRLVSSMQELTRSKAQAGEDEVGYLLVVDAELFRLDAAVRWLDAAEARLRGRAPSSFSPRAPETIDPRPRRRATASS